MPLHSPMKHRPHSPCDRHSPPPSHHSRLPTVTPASQPSFPLPNRHSRFPAVLPDSQPSFPRRRESKPRHLSIGPPDLKPFLVTLAPCHGRVTGIRICVPIRDANCFGPFETHIPRPREPDQKISVLSVPSVVNEPFGVIGSQRRITYILYILCIHVKNLRYSATITRRCKPAKIGNVRK